MARKFVEDDHQAALFKWASMESARKPALSNLFAVPNGGKRNVREATRLKSQGVKAGVPDLMLAYPANGFAGFFIELKRPIVKGESRPSVSKEQSDWIRRLSEAGYRAQVCYGWLEAKEAITDYLGGSDGV